MSHFPQNNFAHDAYVINGFSALESNFDMHRTTASMAPYSVWRPGLGPQFSDAAQRGRHGLAAAEYDSEVDGEYETDEESQPPANNDTIQGASPDLGEGGQETSTSTKLKQGAIFVKMQAKEATLEKRLGQHIRVVRRGPRVHFEGVYWKAPENDRTIPTTDDDKYDCVKSTVAALRNNQDCKEVATRPVFQNRWADDATYYNKEELEVAAWAILDCMIKIHTVGWTKQLLDQKLRDQVQKTMFCTFGERFDALIKLLSHSKRTCEDVLKAERFYTTIGNPFEIEMRTSSNKNSNMRKGSVLKRKMKEMKERKNEGEEEGEDSEDSEGVDRAPKTKRTKNGRV